MLVDWPDGPDGLPPFGGVRFMSGRVSSAMDFEGAGFIIPDEDFFCVEEVTGGDAAVRGSPGVF